MLNYITINKFCDATGYTAKAVREKIRLNIWKENKVWVKAPDNRQLIIINGYESWVETALVLKQHHKQVSKSRLSTGANDAENGLNSSPPPLI